MKACCAPGLDIILGCNGMVWVAPHAPPPALGADGEPEQAPLPPLATLEQRAAVCRVAGALRALAALYFPIFPATLVDAYQARKDLLNAERSLHASQRPVRKHRVPGGGRAARTGRIDLSSFRRYAG